MRHHTSRTSFSRSTSQLQIRRRPSLLSLVVLALLVLGCLTVLVGLACLLFAPLVIGAGAALSLCAVCCYAMIKLTQAVRWLLVQLVHRSRHTMLYLALTPFLTALLRLLARQLVFLLVQWLQQENADEDHRRRKQRRGHRQRQHQFALVFR